MSCCCCRWECESVRFCDHRNEQSQEYSSTISMEIEQNNRHISKCVCVCDMLFVHCHRRCHHRCRNIYHTRERRRKRECEREKDSKHSIDIIELGFICDGIIFDKLHKWALNKNAEWKANKRKLRIENSLSALTADSYLLANFCCCCNQKVEYNQKNHTLARDKQWSALGSGAYSANKPEEQLQKRREESR